MDVQFADFLTIGLLVVLEGLLSADNALVLAMMILGLPRRDQKKALRYGLVGAFSFRIAATLLATYLIRIEWVKLLGGLYLLYLCYEHFFRHGNATERTKVTRAQPWMGLSALWGTVVKVELREVDVHTLARHVAVDERLGQPLGDDARRVEPTQPQ